MKVAAIQAEPAWWDLKAGVAKSISVIKEAASNGAELVGFPESFIPGYPMCIWAKPFNPTFLIKFQKNCLNVQSEEHREIQRAVRDAGIWVVLGFTEIDGASMYDAQTAINPQGNIVMYRRKIKPTGQERTIWGDGPADSLKSAFKGPQGVVVGAFNCWENVQPLLRYHHYSLGVQIHVASWPFLSSKSDGVSPQIASETQVIVNRFLALEGQMFVIASTQIISRKNIPLCELEGTGMWEAQSGGGFAAIYGPDGAQLTDPVDPAQEVILYADIDLETIRTAKLTADPVGH
ncbi:carbon-nitrogen hydrolase [Mycena floridula]|nr:carbon-nitrogen hydrolase [Mycena floridula]